MFFLFLLRFAKVLRVGFGADPVTGRARCGLLSRILSNGLGSLSFLLYLCCTFFGVTYFFVLTWLKLFWDLLGSIVGLFLNPPRLSFVLATPSLDLFLKCWIRSWFSFWSSSVLWLNLAKFVYHFEGLFLAGDPNCYSYFWPEFKLEGSESISVFIRL